MKLDVHSKTSIQYNPVQYTKKKIIKAPIFKSYLENTTRSTSLSRRVSRPRSRLTTFAPTVAGAVVVVVETGQAVILPGGGTRGAMPSGKTGPSTGRITAPANNWVIS